MHQLTIDDLTELLADQKPPCISLYQPTHRHHPENQQDPISYRNSLREMEKSLRQKYPAHEVRSLLAKFQALAHDENFWNHRTDGLAILSTSEMFHIFELQRAVPELLVVADTFHTKPLLRILQSADRYQLLCLNLHEAKLYQGNRDALDPVDLSDIPATMTEALGDEVTEPHQSLASYGKGGGGGGQTIRYGQGSKKDEVDIDMVRFFRAIDRTILEHHSRPSGLPLLLVALPEHHAPFRAVSRNPFLMDEGIQKAPEALDIDELRVQAWQHIEPLYLARLTKLVDRYQTARAAKSGSDDLAQVAQATMTGRVSSLLVEAGRQIPGRISSSGEIESGDLSDPEVDDILDDLAETVLRMKGEVVVVPAERMPSETGVAAIFRY